jgi:2-hydroxy-6-oxonona-2,4-dienedioate hydrolase
MSAEHVAGFDSGGDGPPILLSHGLGGAFDSIARRLALAGFRVIAPSRFGYAGSACPSDPSPERQADAFAAFLDERGVDRVAIVGVSAGALAALRFAKRHAERCLALVVIAPRPCAEPDGDRAGEWLVRSDVLYGLALVLARDMLLRVLFGTLPFVVDAANAKERERAHDLLASLRPIRVRTEGLLADRRAMRAPPSIPFDGVIAPALVVATKDDLFRTIDAARLLAKNLREARLVTYRTGGHAWIGRDEELGDEVLAFLRTVLARD